MNETVVIRTWRTTMKYTLTRKRSQVQILQRPPHDTAGQRHSHSGLLFRAPRRAPQPAPNWPKTANRRVAGERSPDNSSSCRPLSLTYLNLGMVPYLCYRQYGGFACSNHMNEEKALESKSGSAHGFHGRHRHLRRRGWAGEARRPSRRGTV